MAYTANTIAKDYGFDKISREELNQKANETRDSLKQVKEHFKEHADEIKWSGEYIAAVLGVDRMPQSDLVRCARSIQHDLVDIKKQREKDVEHTNDNKDGIGEENGRD